VVLPPPEHLVSGLFEGGENGIAAIVLSHAAQSRMTRAQALRMRPVAGLLFEQYALLYKRSPSAEELLPALQVVYGYEHGGRVYVGSTWAATGLPPERLQKVLKLNQSERAQELSEAAGYIWVHRALAGVSAGQRVALAMAKSYYDPLQQRYLGGGLGGDLPSIRGSQAATVARLNAAIAELVRSGTLPDVSRLSTRFVDGQSTAASRLPTTPPKLPPGAVVPQFDALLYTQLPGSSPGVLAVHALAARAEGTGEVTAFHRTPDGAISMTLQPNANYAEHCDPASPSCEDATRRSNTGWFSANKANFKTTDAANTYWTERTRETLSIAQAQAKAAGIELTPLEMVALVDMSFQTDDITVRGGQFTHPTDPSKSQLFLGFVHWLQAARADPRHRGWQNDWDRALAMVADARVRACQGDCGFVWTFSDRQRRMFPVLAQLLPVTVPPAGGRAGGAAASTVGDAADRNRSAASQRWASDRPLEFEPALRP
jgi:hypothetical protein